MLARYHSWFANLLILPLVTGLFALIMTKYGSSVELWVCYVVAIGFTAWITRPEQYDQKFLAGLLRAVRQVLELSDSSARLTLYVVEPYERWLWMAVPYIPTGETGSLDKLQPGQGIVGRAFRMKGTLLEVLDVTTTPEEYRQELVEKWGFVGSQASRMRVDRRVFLAIPIIHETTVTAVVYCDLQDPKEVGDFTKLKERAEMVSQLVEPVIWSVRGA